MTYAILAIVFLLTVCAWLYCEAIDAEAERDRLRQRYVDAINELAARQADIDERDAVIARQAEVIGKLMDVRNEYVASLLDGRVAARVAEVGELDIPMEQSGRLCYHECITQRGGLGGPARFIT